MYSEDIKKAELIASKVDEAGGRVYYVGGHVRDFLLGKINEDVDIEIHGVSYETLRDILSSVGTLTVMGASFGIFGLKGCELDIAMPRTEKATGAGHRDFEVFVDPFIGPEKAALRRDFTVNAMMQDVLTGEILDFFGGREDLKRGIIRHVNDSSFVEDPLRVLRAAQFSARFNFRIADETLDLCSRMDLSALSHERIMEEMRKALTQAEKPSVFFKVLRQMNQLSYWFPEVEALIGVVQNPSYHSEGDVWTHTMMVIDEAARLRRESTNPFYFMMAAVCHDFGKVTATKITNGEITAFDHDIAGIPPAKKFLHRLTSEKELKNYVLNMVEMHMRPHQLFWRESAEIDFLRVFDKSLEPEDLILMSKSDELGNGKPGDFSERERILRQMLDRYRYLEACEHVTGEDLIRAGMKPGAEFKKTLAYAHDLQLHGISKTEALESTLDYMKN